MKARRLPTGLRILFGILTVMLCISLFSGFVQGILLADAMILTQEDNLKVIINQVFFGDETKKAAPGTVPQAVGGVKLAEIPTDFDEMQDMIVDMLFEMLTEQLEEEIPVTKEDVEALLNESTLPEFLSEKMAGIVSDVVTGEATTTLTGEEVAEQLELNKELIKEHFGFEVTEEYKNEVAKWVDEADVTGKIQSVIKGSSVNGGDFSENAFSDGVINGLLSGEVSVTDVLSGGVSAIVATIRELVSVEALAIVGAECLIIIVLLFVVNMKQLRVAVRSIGITAILAGLPFFVGAILTNAVPSLFAGTIPSVLSLILQMTSVVPIVLLLAGLALVIISVVMSVIRNKRLKAQKAQCAV